MKRILRNTFAVLTKREKKHFLSFLLLDFIINLVDILSLAFLLWLVQFYVQPAAYKTLPFVHWQVSKSSINVISVFFLFFAAKNILAFVVTKAQNNFVAGVAVRISKNNLQYYQNIGFEEFVTVDSSVFIRKIAYQPFDFCQYVLSGLQQIITQSSLILISIIAILLFNAQLFLLLLLILLPPVIVVFYFIRRRLSNDREQIKLTNQRSFQYLMDSLKGFVEGNIYGRNDFFSNRFVEERRKFSKHLFDSTSIQTFPGRLIEVFAILGLFVLILIANWNGNNASSFITIGAFMAAAYKIIPGIVKITNLSGQMRSFEFSASDLGVKEISKKSSSSNNIHSIEFNKVGFSYGAQTILSDLSFSATKGDFIGITGQSGKGKTTIFNLLLGFLSPAKGEILVNQSTITKEEAKEYWPVISYVRQQSFFIHDTVTRNITLEEDCSDEKKLNWAMRISGIDKMLENFPEREDKIITENGKNISGGQQQRIALARAIYKDADLILLDEPFNELDEASEMQLLNHFRNMANAGKIVMMITHNREALKFCNKIISLDDR